MLTHDKEEIMIGSQNNPRHLMTVLRRQFRALVIGVRKWLKWADSPPSTGERGLETWDASGRDGHDAGAINRRKGSETGPLLLLNERILELLARNGGGMKQTEITQAVEYSESTVSRHLSELESSGTIVRYRIGRGKFVYLPGEEPDALKSRADREDEERRLPA